jgi:hypothetical protein
VIPAVDDKFDEVKPPIVTLLAPMIRPLASTVKTGTEEAEP